MPSCRRLASSPLRPATHLAPRLENLLPHWKFRRPGAGMRSKSSSRAHVRHYTTLSGSNLFFGARMAELISRGAPARRPFVLSTTYIAFFSFHLRCSAAQSARKVTLASQLPSRAAVLIFAQGHHHTAIIQCFSSRTNCSLSSAFLPLSAQSAPYNRIQLTEFAEHRNKLSRLVPLNRAASKRRIDASATATNDLLCEGFIFMRAVVGGSFTRCVD